MAEDIKKIAGHNIRRLREKRGWSQEKLAGEAGLHAPTSTGWDGVLLYPVMLCEVVLGAEKLYVLRDQR